MKVFFKIAAMAAALSSLLACEEFQPVFTGKYDNPAKWEPVEIPESKLTPINKLVAMYQDEWTMVEDEIIIGGRVTTNDQQGNFYKSLYIQDETGGIEVKIGRPGLYNDYKPNQMIYVKCQGLILGRYGYSNRPDDEPDEKGEGMVSIGYVSNEGKYENSYLESAFLIDKHILRGHLAEKEEDKISPVPITEAELPDRFDTMEENKYLGKLVTLNGLKYDNKIFCMMYADASHKDRYFLSDGKTWGVTTWAMSKVKMTEYIMSGAWDEAKVGFGGATIGKKKGNGTYPSIEKTAGTVSQYFKLGETSVQIRTSGYAKFADDEIHKDVLDGKKTINATGILSLFKGNVQLTINSREDIVYNK